MAKVKASDLALICQCADKYWRESDELTHEERVTICSAVTTVTVVLQNTAIEIDAHPGWKGGRSGDARLSPRERERRANRRFV